MSHLAFLSIPGLRQKDLDSLPRLQQLMEGGNCSRLIHSFPAVTWPAQATLLTGKLPQDHGVVANGFYWRETDQVEMWTAWNDKITAPQIWDRLGEQGFTSAVWFPMLSKGCGADYVCMPAPVHNPDGSESLWCYTKPSEQYGEFLEALGHFPLKHFWGPLAGIQSTKWIVDSAIMAAEKFRPNFFYLYLPHLDYAAQRDGPDSPAALAALDELDAVIGQLAKGFTAALADSLCWMAISEYTIAPVDHVVYPNRQLRAAGLLSVCGTEQGELLDTANSRAWALVDHQFSHVFVKDADGKTLNNIRDLFEGQEGIAEVLIGEDRTKYGLQHPRAGEAILISEPHSWQAYYYWLDDEQAPPFARTVDIHRKPGYDPVELFFDPETRGVPLDASLVKGSHGAPPNALGSEAVLLCSQDTLCTSAVVHDTQVAQQIERFFQGL